LTQSKLNTLIKVSQTFNPYEPLEAQLSQIKKKEREHKKVRKELKKVEIEAD